MIYKIKVDEIEANWLPVMNETNQSADAYVEIRFKNDIMRTGVSWNTLNPKWNCEYIMFEIDESDLFNDILQIKIMDHDNFSADNTIGRFNLNIIPLLNPETKGVFKGWVPIFDSLIGVRGTVFLYIKLEKINNICITNPYPPCDDIVMIYSMSIIPDGFYLEKIQGLVDDHTFDDDPEDKWIDLIRSQRASNDVRQRILSKLSNQLQYKITQKAISMSANAVLGYKQCFNIEKEYGLCIRGTGTLVTLRQKTSSKFGERNINDENSYDTTDGDQNNKTCFPQDTGKEILKIGSNVSTISANLSESTEESYQPLESILLLTLNCLPLGYYLFIGQMIAAYSVQNLSKHEDDTNYSDTKDQWWSELRHELKTHAHVLGCNMVIGYTENEEIVDDMTVLSVFGTAVLVDIMRDKKDKAWCSLLHIPGTFKEKKHIMCQYCCKHRSTIHIYSNASLPLGIPILKSCGLVSVCSIKNLKYYKHEELSETVSNVLPYLENELMTKFGKKIMLMQCNAAFNITTRISINSNYILMTRSGNAYEIGPFLYNETVIGSRSNVSTNENMDPAREDDLEEIPRILANFYTELPGTQQKIDIYETFLLYSPQCRMETSNYIQDIDEYDVSSLACFTYVLGTEIPTNSQNLEEFIKDFLLITILDKKSHSFYLSNIFVDHLFGEENFLYIMVNQTNSTKKNVKPRSSIKNELTKLTSIEQRRTEENRNINNNIILTNLDHIPLMKNRYVNLGYINYCLIKETTDTKEGGVENFLTTFIEEAICIFKNYAAGLGAEAIISFKIDELKILNYPKRNQAESLIYLSGNAIKLKIID